NRCRDSGLGSSFAADTCRQHEPRPSGTLNDNPSLRTSVQALTRAGITVAVAAGNDSTLEVSQQVPATYPEVIAVASTTGMAGTSACAGYQAPSSATRRRISRRTARSTR